MIVIWGRRAFGRVEKHAGERAQTTFFHLWYVPLVPTGSMWVLSDKRAIATRMNARSVVTTYARVWAALIAFGLLATTNLPMMIAGGVLALLSIAAWVSGGVGDVRRSDFNRLAFGMRCEPSRMLPALRADLKAALGARWEAIANGRTPEDLAKYGARTLDDAVVAYGLLRLAAVDRGDGDALADRILRGSYDAPPADGPYRTEAAAPEPAAVIAEIEAKAASLYTPPAQVLGPIDAWWAFDIKKLVIGLGFVGVSYALIAAQLPKMQPRHVTASELGRASWDELIEVTCDDVEDLGRIGERTGYACDLGDKVVLVIAESTSGTTFTGHARSVDKDTWGEQLVTLPNLVQKTLEETSTLEARAFVVGSLLYDLAFLGLMIAWVVQWRRRRTA